MRGKVSQHLHVVLVVRGSYLEEYYLAARPEPRAPLDTGGGGKPDPIALYS